MNRAPLRVSTFHTNAPGESLRKTIELIGEAIHNGSTYLPIRNHAAGLASTAAPKDYLGQVQAIYDDFVKRWRYVKDPIASETVTTTGPAIYALTLGGRGKPGEKGFGDCDDATVALSSLLQSCGFETRIRTIAGPRAHDQQLFTHVYPQVKIPRVGWVSVDAVGHPSHGLGWTPPAKRESTWSTHGDFLGARGDFPPHLLRVLKSMRKKTKPARLHGLGNTEVIDTMRPNNEQYPDYGMYRYGLAGHMNDDTELADWSVDALAGFGAYAGQLGIVNYDQCGLLMEYDEDDDEGQGLVRTRMLEMRPEDVAIVRTYGKPRLGTVALGDDGAVYQWQETPDGLGGFFKKIFRKVKKKVKKVVKRVVKKVRKTARQLVKALPGGKYLLKLHDKIHKVAMKLTRPLRKLIGKFASRLAPIAALIPGWGPAIAAGLYTAGKIAKIMDRFDIRTDKKGKPKFKSGAQAKKFKRSLEKAARKEKKRQRKKKARQIRQRQERQTRRSTRVAARRSPRLLKAGTREHKAALRGYGLDLGEW